MNKHLSVLLFLFFCSCTSKPDSPCILQATYDGAPFSSSFIFKKDRTFEWLNGLTTQINGRYSLKDSIITLDNIGFDKIIKSKKLLITTVNPNTGLKGRYVVQVNDDIKVIDSQFVFSIYVDTRN